MGGDSCYLAVLCVCVYVLLDCVVCVNLFFMASTNSKIVTLAVELQKCVECDVCVAR